MEIKKMIVCDLLSRYRDGELAPALKAEFESHLTLCNECRRALSLLNNIVRVLVPAVPAIPISAELIAHRAFRQGTRWDLMVLSWIRPAPAYAALAFALLVSSLLWFVPMSRPVDAYGEYEVLIATTPTAQPQTDEELVRFIEEGGIQ
jgi:anti-sigma factor RsiW